MSDEDIVEDPAVGGLPARQWNVLKIAVVLTVVAVICVSIVAVIVMSPPRSSPELPCERSEVMPIEFSSVTKGGTPPFNYSVSWEVTCVNRRIPSTTSYEVWIQRNTEQTPATHHPLVFGTNIILSQPVQLRVTDADGNKQLSVGDTFLVFGMEDHYLWTLYVGSTEGSEILGAANWDTLAELPTMTFSQPTYDGTPAINATVTWTVSDTTERTYAFSHYEVQLKRDGVPLHLSKITLHPNASIILGSYYSDVKLIVSDLAGDGNLSLGDRFFVHQMHPDISWNFTLYWFQNSVGLESIEWTTAQMPKPVVKFGAITKDGTPPSNHTASWTIAEASGPAYLLDSYRVTVKMDGNDLGSYPMNLTAGYTMDFGSSVIVIFQDFGGDDVLTLGDSFLVYGMSEPHRWNLSLLWWQDDYVLAWANWSTEAPKPMIAFTSQAQGGSSPNITATWMVAGASAAYSFSSYKVQVEMDGAPLGSMVFLSAGTIIQLGGTVNLTVTDLSGDGKLGAGDRFLVYGMDASHSWRFHLIWAWDDTDVQTQAWNT